MPVSGHVPTYRTSTLLKRKDGSASGFLTIVKLRAITLGNLGAEEAGADETQYGDSREDDNMLVASPAERVLLTHELQKTIEGDTACYKEDGDKHRSEKSINHNTGSLRVATLPQQQSGCKGRGFRWRYIGIISPDTISYI